MNILSAESIARLNTTSINNNIPVHSTYLNLAVSSENITAIDLLLHSGANPNGITDIGVSEYVPLTSCKWGGASLYTIVNKLLLSGAKINMMDVRGHTILTSYVSFALDEYNFSLPDVIDRMRFILDRGANPDGTIFNNPLVMIINAAIRSNSMISEDIIYKLCEVLISHNANIKYSTIELYSQRNNRTMTSNKLLASIINYDDMRLSSIVDLFNLNISRLVRDCKSSEILSSVAEYYKIPYVNSDSGRKRVRDCIDSINRNKDDYNEDDFADIRRRVELLQNPQQLTCQNETILSGDSIYSFSSTELVYLDNNNIRYCFHRSEIPLLLERRTNPYTAAPLTENFLNKIVKIKYIALQTLESALDTVFNQPEVAVTNKILIENMTHYISSFNSYIQIDEIQNLSTGDLVEIIQILYDGNNVTIKDNTMVSDLRGLIGESTQETTTRLVERALTHMFVYLKRKPNSIPRISNTIDQVVTLSKVAREILSLFPQGKAVISGFARTASWDKFCNSFMAFAIRNIDDAMIILDDSLFKNSGTVASYDTPLLKIKSLYKGYVISRITEILNRTFTGLPLAEAWNDTVPYITRSNLVR